MRGIELGSSEGGAIASDDGADIQIPSCLASRPGCLPRHESWLWCGVFDDMNSVQGISGVYFVTSSGTEHVELDDTFFSENDLYCITDKACAFATNGGYGFELKKVYIDEQGALCYQIDKTPPPQGAITTQEIKECCLVVAVPKSSRVETVRCLNCNEVFGCEQARMSTSRFLS